MTPKRRHSLDEVLGPLEAETMEVVWAEGEVTVRDVHRTLRTARPIAYTTVMTTLGRLADKGFLAKLQEQPAHRYRPLVSRQQYASSTVKSVVDWLLNHFPTPAVAYFVDRAEENVEVMEELREAIDRRREGPGPD